MQNLRGVIMMRLSKTPFLALVSLFILVNIFVTSAIVRTAPSPKAEKPFQDIVESYWLEKDPAKQDVLLESLYPELAKSFPQLIQVHQFFTNNRKINQTEGRQALSELTLKIFSLHSFVKRRNWQTLSRMSYQGLQHYGSALQRYITEDKFDVSKVFAFNQEMKNLTMNSKLRPDDKKIVMAKISSINKDLNRAEGYVGKKHNLNKIKGELNNELATLSSFVRPSAGISYLDSVTQLPFKTIELIVAQYLISGFIFFMLMGLYRPREEVLYNAIYGETDQPMALLDKKGRFRSINKALKEVLPFTKFNMINKMNWDSFEKLARIDFKTPIKEVVLPLTTSGTFTINEEPHEFMVRLSPNKKLKGYILTLTPNHEIQTYQEIHDVPAFTPPKVEEDVFLSHILEDVVTDMSNLFQSKKVNLQLDIKGERHVLTGDMNKTYRAFSEFIRDMVLALSPKSKSKNFKLTLEQTLDGVVLTARMDDVKLASPILKSNFKVDANGKTVKRNLNQGIEGLKNAELGFDIDLNFKNNFDIDNKFVGSNISIAMT